jgi:hypothetical protein
MENQPNLVPSTQTKKTPMEMISIGMAQIINKVKAPFSKQKTTPINIVGQPQPASPIPAHVEPQVAVSSTPKKGHKKLIIFAVGFILFIAVMMFLSVALGIKLPGQDLIMPPPAPTPTAPPVVFTPAPNKYASDPEIIKLQQDIESLDKELQTIDIDETNLKPRPYQWDVNFK